MSTPSTAQQERTPAHRPTRWPHPDALSLVLFGGWVVGILVATVIPYSLVPPTTRDPDTVRVWTAFGVTLVGIVIFVVSGLLLSRHIKSQAAVVMALVPVVSIGAGSIILTATLLAL